VGQKHANFQWTAVAAFLAALNVIGCAQRIPSPIAANRSLARGRDYWPTKEWRTAGPEESGMDGTILSGISSQMAAHQMLAALVVRNGSIVYERYRPEYYAGSQFPIYSCTKSITSALVGIALDRGLIKSIDRPVSEFFPRIAQTADAPRKSRLTLRHLLSMSSGLDWSEWGAWDYYFQPMVDSPNWVDFVLARPMAEAPGKVFNYNSGGSQVLSAIVGLRTGMPAAEFARRELFDGIGIGPVTWPADPNGVSTGGYGVRMTARDAARFGYLFLNNGVWEGRQVVSPGWVEESTRQQSEGHSWFGRYGLHWWLRTLGDARARTTFFAMGYGGQYIFVVPALDLVAVFFSWMLGDSSFLPMQWLEDFVVKAVR
jgi:CubicO group peptidase (beta-lactamase class C family)